MPAISLDTAYAPELVEFWGQKYKDLKEEYDKLKVRSCWFMMAICDLLMQQSFLTLCSS